MEIQDDIHKHVVQVIQKECSNDLTTAVEQFNIIDQYGRNPLVLVPEPRCCMSSFIRIPSGVSAIVQRFGADVGEWPAGFHWTPIWYRVAFMVTKQSCTYYYSVSNCPTKDNVMVKVEVTLVFRILKARDFVHSLGATKFDDMLKAVSEEAIRANVRMVKHNHIYELRGSGADELMKVLNTKFSKFGVMFTNTTIVNVVLPRDLASALEHATTFDAQMRQQIRSQEFNLKILNDDNDKLLKELHLENERSMAAEFARKERVAIDLQIKKSDFERNKKLAIVKGEQDIAVMKRNAQAQLENETVNAQANYESTLKVQQGESQAEILRAEQFSQSEKLQSEAVLIEATNRAKSITFEADAESKVFKQIQKKRKFDLQLKSLKALQNLAGRGKIVISGNSGKAFIESITQGTPLLSSAEIK